jgi:putative methionine-R-sulfoxide reductase with GAF domain
MNTPIASTPDEKTERKRNAIRAGWVITMVGVMLAAWGIYAYTQRSDTTRIIFLLSHILFLLFAISSLWLSHRGRSTAGAMLLISATMVETSVLGIFGRGQGFLYFLLTVLIVSVISIWALARRERLFTTFASVVVGLFLLLFDLFSSAPWRQETISPLVVPILGGAIIIGFLIILATQFRLFSLRAKLITAFLATAVIPLAILAFVNDSSTRTALTNDANQALGSAASQTAIQLDSFINNGLDTIRTQASLKVASDFLSLPASQRTEQNANILAFLTTLVRQNPVYISSVAILDINGVDIADTFTGDVGLDKSDRDYFKKALETELPYVSDVEFSQTTGEASLYFSAPVRNTAGDILGVIRTRYNANALQQIVSANNNLVGQGSFAVLLDAEHYVRLAHGTTPALIFKTIASLEAATVSDLQARRLLPPGTPQELSTNQLDFEQGLDKFIAQPFFAADLTGDTNSEQVAVVSMETQNWLVAFAVPQTVFLAPINTQAQTNILLTLGMAVLVAAFGVFISQTLSGPIVRLTQTAEKIAGGDINLQAKVETGDEIGILAGTFNRMTAQLRDFIVNLEARVAARTKDLATVAEVGTATATILETDKLLQAVVDLAKDRFNLYHSHIYLLDETGQNLVLTSGAGDVGRTMVAQKRSIPLNSEQSLVARAARERKGVTVNDVTLTPDFLPNPLLPYTRSELAVPMIVSGNVIGVFDVQSDQVGRFTDADISIQTTLAAQVSTSIQNVRSFEQSQAQAEFETLVNAIGQKIQRAASVEDVLQIAAREVGRALEGSRVRASIQSSQVRGDQSRRN